MSIRSIMIKPASGNCNMSCNYCFYCDEMNCREQSNHGFMTYETIENIISKTLRNANSGIYYSFQGGEPTLCGIDFYKSVIELQQKYNHNRVPITNVLQTNGYMLNDEWCQFFKENYFLIGVSVDGTKEIHDLYRHTKDHSSGTYNRIVSNIKLLDKYGVDYNILTVVTKQAAEHITDIYRAYKQHGWHYLQFIDCLDPFQSESSTLPYSLDASSFGKYMVTLFDLWFANLQTGQHPYIRRFENYVAILAGYHPESCEQAGHCGMQIVVEADGSAYPCDFYAMDSFLLGNFNDNELEEMDAARHRLGFIQQSFKITQTCKECKYFHICRSGCHRNRIFLPSENAFQNRLCEGYRYFFDHCYDRIAHIARMISNYEKSSEF